MSTTYFKRRIYLDLTSWNISLGRNIYLALALLRYLLQIYSETINVLLWRRYFFKILNNAEVKNKGNPCLRLSSHSCIVIFCRRISRIWEVCLCMMLSIYCQIYHAEIFPKAKNTPQEILLGICSRLGALQSLHVLTFDGAWGGSFWSTWMSHQSNL